MSDCGNVKKHLHNLWAPYCGKAQFTSCVWLTVRRAKDQSPRHYPSALSPDDWLARANANLQGGRGRGGKGDLSLWVTSGHWEQSSKQDGVRFRFDSPPWLLKTLPPSPFLSLPPSCTWRHLAARGFLTGSREAKGGVGWGRGGGVALISGRWS